MTSVPVPAADAASAEPSGTKIGPVIIAFVAGTAVSIGLGVYGRLHTPTGYAVNIAGFSNGPAAKAALASVAMAFGVVQVVTALGIYGRIPLRGAWLSPVHRWSGRLAVLISVPVVVIPGNDQTHASVNGRIAAAKIPGAVLHALPIEDKEVPLINYPEWAPYEEEIAATFLELMRKIEAPRARGQAAAS